MNIGRFIAHMMIAVVALGGYANLDYSGHVPTINMGYINAADARFRSGGFSSRPVRVSSFRSSSSRSSKSTRTSSSSSKSKAASTSTRSVAPPKRTPLQRAASRQQSRVAAQKAAHTQRAKYKEPVNSSVRSSTLRNTDASTRARLTNVDRSTYYTRRNSTMNKYRSQSSLDNNIVYMGQPSYGVFDSWFFWYVVLNDPMYGHNHASDPAYQQWKQDAEKLSSENAELKQQLTQYDQKLAALEGRPANPDYLPEGVDADVIYAPEYVEATVPTVRLCTATTSGTYHKAGSVMGNLASESKVQVVATAGSVQNLKMLQNGKCDAALVQRDAYLVFDSENPDSDLGLRRIGSLYDESAHLFCSTDSEIGHLEDLDNRKDIALYVGDAGSGAATTWANITKSHDGLDGVKVVNKPATDSSFGANNHCGLYVGFEGSEYMRTVSAGKGDKEVRMVDIESVPTDVIRDPEGKNVYSLDTIDDDTYISQRGWNDTGMFNDTPTVTVPVDLVVADNWIESFATTKVPDGIMEEYSELRPAVLGSLK